MAERVWQVIRALRATPPGEAAADDDRRHTFGAALEQAEQLAEAADAVGYAAKPLPLFYSLSQAGRAITAVQLAEPWRPRGHGLKCESAGPRGLLEATVKPQGKTTTSFALVAKAVHSPRLSGATTLGALWAANPDLVDVPIPDSEGSWPPALRFRIEDPGFPLLPGSSPTHATVTTGGILPISIDLPGETAADLISAAQRYPTLRATRPVKREVVGPVWMEPDDPVDRHPLNPLVKVGVPIEGVSSYQRVREVQISLASVVEIEGFYPGSDGPILAGYAMPELGGASGPPPHPLMLWWALLLGLSSFARYEPAAWSAALDLDRSELAATLEQALDLAVTRVPERILRALRDT